MGGFPQERVFFPPCDASYTPTEALETALCIYPLDIAIRVLHSLQTKVSRGVKGHQTETHKA